jgi:hypothetical protein
VGSSLDQGLHEIGRGFGRIASVLSRGDGPRQVLAMLGWDTPPAVSDIGLSALDLSEVVSAIGSLDVAISVGTSGVALDAKYAEVAVAVGSLVRNIDGFAAGLSASAGYLSATQITSQFVPRLLDFVVVEALSSNAMVLVGGLSFLGVIEFRPFDADPSIFQLAHVRRIVHWDRAPRLFSDIKGLLADVHRWGKPGFDATPLVTALGGILQGLSASIAVRALPRRAEHALVGHDVPEADATPMTQLMLSIRRGLAWTPVSAGLSVIALRPSAAGAADAGFAFAPYLRGTTDLSFPLSAATTFFLDASLDLSTGVALIVRAGSDATLKSNLTKGGIGSALEGHLLAGLKYSPGSTAAVPVIALTEGFGIYAHSVSFAAGADISGGQLSALAKASLSGGHLTIDPSQMDSFIAKIIPLNVDVAFDFGIGWSSSYGFFFEGSASPAVTFGLHQSLGPFTIDTLHASLDLGSGSTLPLEISVTGSGALGPFSVSVDRIGMTATVVARRGNLGPLDLSLGFKPPNGLGVELDAGLISGGGYVFIDEQNHRYAGVLECSIADIVQVKVVCVIDTVLPDGRREFSLLLVITTDFPPIQLSFGFTLNGVGGVGGVNRTMSLDALRAGFRAHHLDSVLFPSDPIDNAPQIISDLSSFFPPADGRYVFGPMFELGWGTPSLITLSVGVVLSIPDPVTLVILGEVRVALPSSDIGLIELNIDVLGIIDFGAKLLTIQGSMYDSHVVIYSVSGDMGLMLSWGDNPNFAFSVGGLNPRFTPPPNFPQLARCCVSISDGDNPRLSSLSYFAVTSNSVQFGASVDLYAAAGGFSIHGWVGFDALFIFSPFSFLISYSAGLDVEFEGDSLCSIHIDGSLAGPRPWHVHGDASFHILFIDVSASVDLSWGPSDPVTLPPVEVLPELIQALTNPQSWSTKLPPEVTPAVSLAPRAAGDSSLVVHPLGTLEVREKVVPLGIPISKFGNAQPSDGTLFAISSVSVDGKTETEQPLKDFFAIGQFTDQTDDQKLTAPSYQYFESGISIGSSDVVTSRDVQCVVAYQDGYIDGDDTGMRLGPTFVMPKNLQLAYSRRGAGFVSAARTKGVSKFTPPGTLGAVASADASYVIASTDDLSVRRDLLGTPVTHFEAHSVLQAHLAANPADHGALQVVAEYEVAA